MFYLIEINLVIYKFACVATALNEIITLCDESLKPVFKVNAKMLTWKQTFIDIYFILLHDGLKERNSYWQSLIDILLIFLI